MKREVGNAECEARSAEREVRSAEKINELIRKIEEYLIFINQMMQVGERSLKRRDKTGRFVPPTIEQVAAYCKERGYEMDAEEFVAFYGSKGWYVGARRMVNWQNAVTYWYKNRRRKAMELEDSRTRAKRPDNWHQGSKEMYDDVVRVLGG